MISHLFRFLVVVFAGWLIARLFRGAVRPAAPGRGQIRREGEMVRDRVCNTFLPRSSALIERDGRETHYFCSESCRIRFLGSRPGATATGSGSNPSATTS